MINITTRNAQIASVFLEPAHNCGVLLLALGDCQRREEMTEFLTNMPTETRIFITMAVLGLAGTLIVLRRLI